MPRKPYLSFSSPLLLRELLCGSAHFNDLHRGVPLMSRTVLSQRLRSLEQVGVLRRELGSRGPEYHLTQAGREFAPLIRQLGEWRQRWFRSEFNGDELDPGILLWDIRRGVKPEALPQLRVAVRFNFSDQPSSKRSWWLVCDQGEVDICPTDPGYEVDLYVDTDLRTMTRLWMGDVSTRSAIRSRDVVLTGRRELRQNFEQWLGLSTFAPIKDARAAAAQAIGTGRARAEQLETPVAG